MGYLLSDQEIVKAAVALNRAQDDASDEGIPAYLYVLLSVSDDTRAKLVADPNWLMEDHSSDGHWEEAQEAFAEWENEVDPDFVHETFMKLTDDWPMWIPEIREHINARRVGSR